MFRAFNQHPYVQYLQEEGIVVEISQDPSSVAFVKNNPYAVLDIQNGWDVYWQNDRLLLNGITFMYCQWHLIESNTVLKAYLTQLLGYDYNEVKEKSNE